MSPLHGNQADEVREIAQREIVRFAELLQQELERGGTIRADGNIPGLTMIDCVAEARADYARGEVPR